MAYPRAKPLAIGARHPCPALSSQRLRPRSRKCRPAIRWIHEVKFDGYRVQVHLANAAVRVLTRRGHDWTNRFKKIANDAWHI
jgi:bifunctional non-homologous end joining protein LigD